MTIASASYESIALGRIGDIAFYYQRYNNVCLFRACFHGTRNIDDAHASSTREQKVRGKRSSHRHVCHKSMPPSRSYSSPSASTEKKSDRWTDRQKDKQREREGEFHLLSLAALIAMCSCPALRRSAIRDTKENTNDAARYKGDNRVHTCTNSTRREPPRRVQGPWRCTCSCRCAYTMVDHKCRMLMSRINIRLRIIALVIYGIIIFYGIWNYRLLSLTLHRRTLRIYCVAFHCVACERRQERQKKRIWLVFLSLSIFLLSASPSLPLSRSNR